MPTSARRRSTRTLTSSTWPASTTQPIHARAAGDPRMAMFDPHGTTILGVRRDGQVAMGGDGQVTLGNTVMKGNARKVRRLHDGKVLAGFAGGTADAFTLFERFEGKLQGVRRQPDARRDRARQGLAHRPLPAAARGAAAGRRRDQTLLVISGNGDVIEPDDGVMAHRLGRRLTRRPRRARCSTHTDARRARDRRAQRSAIAADICIYTNRNLITDRGMLESDRVYAPLTPTRDRRRSSTSYIVGQDDGQARRGHRAAQPLAPHAGRRGAARRDHAEEHPDDRADRRRQDRDRAAPGQARQRAVRQGRGHQVHRGGLRRPRRRVHRPRPGRGGREAGRARRRWTRCGSAPRTPPRSACSTRCCRGRARVGFDGRAGAAARWRHAAEASARCCARASSTTARSRSRSRADAGGRRDHGAAGHGGDAAAAAGRCSRTLRRAHAETAPAEGARGAQAARRRKRPPSSSTTEELKPQALRGAEQNGIVFIDEIDKIAGARRRPSAPTCRARACSATCCRSSRAAPSRPSTAWSRPTTSCSSPRAPSTCRKPSDLIPELQGRFPIRVELEALERRRLRAHPDRAGRLALPAVHRAARHRGRDARASTADGVRRDRRGRVSRSTSAPRTSARAALHTVMERLLEALSFEAPDRGGRASPWTRPTWTATWASSRATRTSAATSSDRPARRSPQRRCP